jgi:predicted permease
MSTPDPRLPLPARLLLQCVPLGDRRDECASDLAELFATRRRDRGLVSAYWRLLQDVISLMSVRQPSSWLSDMRYGLRLVRKHPGVIGATIGGLALAIAVGTTVFTILNVSLLRSFGMHDPGSIVSVRMLFTQGNSTSWPYHAFIDMRDRAHQSDVAASIEDRVPFSPSAEETPARLDPLMLVSGNYLPTLGGRAILGRSLLPSDDESGAPPVVVLNYRFWATRMHGDPSIVGKTIWLSGGAVVVAGVLAASFTGPVDQPPAFWAPFGSYATIFGDRPLSRASSSQVDVIARVGHGVDRAAAAQELSAIVAALPDVGIRSETKGLLPATGVRLDGAASPMDGADSTEMLAGVSIVLLVVGLVLALACANVANLLLAGAAARAREIGVRLALGASRRRILRQLLSESVLLGLIAGAAGLALSMWLVPLVTRLVGLSDLFDVRPDLPVILFTAAMAVICGMATGLAPARHGARADVLVVLKSDGANASAPPKAARTRRLFLGFQAAASVLLLVTAALFLRAAVRITHVDLGFDADRLIEVTPAFPRSDFDTAAANAYWREATQRVRALPSVEQASLALYPPFAGVVSIRQVPGIVSHGERYQTYENRTDESYLRTVGLQLTRGRWFTADEVRANAPVAVVSESIARDFYGGADPVGASLSAMANDLAPITIVGVIKEAVTAHLRGPGNGTIHRPLPSSEMLAARLMIRTADPAAVVRHLETALASVDPRVRPAASLVSQHVDRYMSEPKILAGVSGTIALLALVLAVLGLYGVTTFVVGQRMWEMHVRQAIGASAGDVVRLLVRQSLTPVAIGLVVGLAVALAAVRVLTPALMGISPYDPSAIVGAVAVLLGAASAAVISPARRAARADPAAVLRGL